jgi:hypothetical protein
VSAVVARAFTSEPSGTEPVCIITEQGSNVMRTIAESGIRQIDMSAHDFREQKRRSRHLRRDDDVHRAEDQSKSPRNRNEEKEDSWLLPNK